MNHIENTSPSKDEEFDWDPSETTVTAWSASHTRGTKGRRAYGRRGSKKSTNGDNIRRRANQRRPQPPETSRTVEEEGADIKESSSYNSGEWGPASSNSPFGLTRSETLPIIPAVGFDIRSKSGAAISAVPHRPPLIRHSRSMSFRSESRSSTASSSSSSISFDSRFGSCENSQPNIAPMLGAPSTTSLLSPQPPTKLKKIDMTPSDIETKGSAKRRKHRQRLSETENSDSSPSFMSTSNSNNSFSRLAKSAEMAVAWIKPPDLSSPSLKDTIGFDFGCLTDATIASPTNSVATTGSSRKRGVCELPFDDVEESSFNAGHSFMSSSSYDTRSRSRSRIFSNASFSRPTMAEDALDPSDLFSRNGADIDSHDEKSDNEASAVESEASNDSSSDHAMDIEEDAPRQVIKNQSLVPPKPVRRSSNDFEESIFGVTKNKSTIVDPLDPSQIFEAMSDYEDLKFLIKALRKEKHGSTIASFGTTKTWTIAPSAAWDSRRRAAFLQWARRGLGFSIRAGGGAVAFLQTTVTKGGVILESLEAALIAHKAQNKDAVVDIPNRTIPKNVAILSTAENTRYVRLLTKVFQSPYKRHNSPRPFLFLNRPSSRRTLARKQSSSVDGDVDMELLSGMESLNFVDKMESVASTEVAVASSHSPLVRIVTLDTALASPHQNHQGMECLPTLMDIAESPHPPPRLSNEHHASGHDLVLHLHGLSPNHSEPPALPMRRLSRQSIGRPSAVRTSNVPFDEDECWET